MKIKWIGHSCFIIETESKTTLLIDPYNPFIGYNPIEYNADIITLSHNHFDHNIKNNLNLSPLLINCATKYKFKDIEIEGFKSYHDKLNGLKRGENLIFKFNIEGYTLCHLGDLGHIPSKEFINTLGKIDILFIPIGGNYTLNGKEASLLCKNLKSHIVIPMHFGTNNLKIKLDGIEKFLIHMQSNTKVSNNTIFIDNSIKSHTNLVYIFNTLQVK